MFQQQRQMLRRPWVAGLCAFFLSLVISVFIIWRIEQVQQQAARSDAQNLAQNHAFLIRDSLDQALSLNYALASLIRIEQGSAQHFELFARELLPFYTRVSYLSIAPKGVISHVFPQEGNELSLGLNQLQDSAQKRGVKRALSAGQLTLAGPLELVDGGLGVVGILPVFLEDAGTNRFWGLTNVVIRIPNLLQAAQLDHLAAQGMAYKLWRINPNTGMEQVIAGSNSALKSPVEKTLSIPNGQWTLSISPIVGWVDIYGLIAKVLLALLLCSLVGLQSGMMVHVQWRRARLEEAVARQTKIVSAAKENLEALLDAIPDLLLEIDFDGVIKSYHSNRRNPFSLPDGTFLEHRFQEFLSPEASAVVEAALQEADTNGYAQGYSYTVNLVKGKRIYELSVARKKVMDNGDKCFVVLSRNITDRHANEERIHRLAFFDPLTDLPNRSLLRDRLEQAVISSQREQRHGALLFIDLDDFKSLNDNRGHHIGDLLLVAVAERLVKSVREQDTVARLGGDEFLVVLEKLDEDYELAVEQARQVGEKILHELNLAYHLEGQDYFNSSSIGICLYSPQQRNIDELMKQADQAMYHAKAAGRNTLRFFDPSMQALTAQRFALQGELREALIRKEFQLYYQPQVNLAGKVIGAEALIRWHHPVKGMVPPLDFIPLAEESGLIVPLGEWIITTACIQLLAWSKAPQTAHLSLSINVSARQFQHPDSGIW